MIAYALGKEIKAERIIQDIQKLCNKIPQEEIIQTSLVISLQKIVDYHGDSLLPKIEYKK